MMYSVISIAQTKYIRDAHGIPGVMENIMEFGWFVVFLCFVIPSISDIFIIVRLGRWKVKCMKFYCLIDYTVSVEVLRNVYMDVINEKSNL